MIHRIKITDFKSIRLLDLTLDPVTVLVGRSGTGKSNIVHALRFLRNLLINPAQAMAWEGGWHRMVPAGKKNPLPSFEVSFSVPGAPLEYNYQIGLASDQNSPGFRVTTERLSIGRETVFARSGAPNAWSWETTPKIAAIPQVANGYPMLGSFPSLEKAVTAYAVLSSGIGYYYFPSTTLDLSKQPAEQQLDLAKAIPGLADNASNYREVLRGITQDFHRPNVRKSLLASLKAVNPSIVAVELDSLTNPNKVIVTHATPAGLIELTLEQESDGLRRFYAHLLALYQTPPKLTLVMEEPENAIFHGALSLLADEFKAAPREDRGQVLLTTHSPALLDSFDVESVRVVEMKDGWTTAGPVSKAQRDAVQDHLLTTGELLTVDQARTDSEPATAQPA